MHQTGIVHKPGRLVFASGIVAFGVENLIWARFGQAASPIIPWVPGYPLAGYLVGVALLSLGLGIALNVGARLCAIQFGLLFILCALILQAPKAVTRPLDIGIRTVVFEPLALAGAALVLAGSLRADSSYSPTVDRGINYLIRSGRFLFAVSSVIFGIDHFLALGFIAKLVPDWIPGGLFWANLTGAGFIVAGVSIAIRWMERWCAGLLATMFGLWFLILHAPRVLGLSIAKVPGAPHNPNEWSSAAIALAMCGASWIFSESADTAAEKANTLPMPMATSGA